MPRMKPADLQEVPSKREFEAILASLRLWLLGVLAAFLEIVPKHRLTRAIAAALRANLHAAEYDMKRAILGLAILRMGKLTQRVRKPGGFAMRCWSAGPVRVATRGSFNRRPLHLRARIARLRDILDNIELWTARLLKRLHRGFNGDHLVIAAPPVVRAFAAPALALDAADSS